jgi:hypothetical protein
MSRVDGQSFNLVSLEAAIGRSTIELPYYINSATLNLTGYIAGGGTVTQTLELHKNWNWYSLKGFQNLTQLVFEGNTLPGFGIDNLSDVPEPDTQYLILLAAVAIAVARRRRSS